MTQNWVKSPVGFKFYLRLLLFLGKDYRWIWCLKVNIYTKSKVKILSQKKNSNSTDKFVPFESCVLGNLKV